MPILLFIPLIEVLGGSEIKKNDKNKDEDVKQDLITFFTNENGTK